MTGSVLKTAFWAILLVLFLHSSGQAGPLPQGSCSGTAPAPKARFPRPCLVPAVPLKKGLPPAIGGPANPAAQVRTQGRPGLTPREAGLAGPTALRVLALRVDFEQDPMDSTAAYFERLLLFMGQYYEETSGGKLTLQTTLAPAVYRLPQSLEYYGFDDSIGVREAILAYDAVRAADPDIDYRQYDDVLIFHAGPGQESDVKDDSPDQIWSLFLRQEDIAYYLPRPGAARGIATDDRTAEGDTVFVTDTAIYPETESQDGFVFSCVGVVIHEFGHALGLPDLYDTVAPEDQIFAESQGIGSWELMSSGTWNANGFVPAELSAWSKVFLGWVDPVVIASDSRVALRAIQEDRSRGVVKVPLGGDEYLLIENRLQDANLNGWFDYDETDANCIHGRAGADTARACSFDFYRDSYRGAEWDWWLPGEGKGSGLLIWHIDDSVIRDNMFYNTVNADPAHKGVDLEEADGIQDMDSPAVDAESFGSRYDAWRAGWADRFGPDTVPNSDGYYGASSYITIDQISAADSVMTFRVSFGGGHEEWPVMTPAPIGGNHVAIGAVDGTGRRNVAVADRDGNLFLLEPDGSPAWTGGPGRAFAGLHTPVGSPLMADVNGDGLDDFIVAADDGRIFGFAGPSGRPMGLDGTGLLVQSTNPMPGVALWAFDLRPTVPGVEFGFGGAAEVVQGDTLSRVSLFSVAPDGRAVSRGNASLHGGSGELPSMLVDVDGDGRLELLSSVRGGTAERPRGFVQLQALLLSGGDQILGTAYANAPLPDSAVYSAPVVTDLNRDGHMDAVVTASSGFIYALTMGLDDTGKPWFELMPGWPRFVFGSGNDAVSLADVDGNGYPEVLALETGGVLHIFNYHGESLVSLPEQIPSEVRYFVEPQLAPLVVDLTADGRPEIVLPLRDGQVRAVTSDGSPFGSWNYFGGGNTASSPAVEDLTGDGQIDLVIAGDHAGGGRIDARTIGRAAGAPLWGMLRHSGHNDGLLTIRPGQPVVNGPALTDVFVMPNPVRAKARVHYRVGDGIETVSVEIMDMLGRGVRRLTGTAFRGSDNTVEWDLTGSDGAPVTPGVYIARIEARGPETSKLSLLKMAVVR